MNQALSLLLLSCLALAASCEAPHSKQLPRHPGSAAPRPTTAPVLEPIRTPRPQAMQLGYHRYVGTVGGQPVVVELTVTVPSFPDDIPNNSECIGQYYDTRSGVVYGLQSDGLFWPNHPLELIGGQDATGITRRWCATQRFGPYLSGTCVSGSGRAPVPFLLRESYTGAVRYEVLREEVRGRVGRNYFGEPDSSIIITEHLHLLGPDTARPALAKLQCPRLARRQRARQALSAKLTPTPEDMAAVYDRSTAVMLNEADILACHEYLTESVVMKHRSEYSGRYRVFDLRTGQPLDVLAQLRPGGLQVLRQRITRQALRDTAAYARDYWMKDGRMPLPTDGFALTPAGWEADYSTTEDEEPQAFQWQISWAELGPFLRPGSPLLRLVRARSERANPPHRNNSAK